jgi:regulator of sigma E protease
LGANGDFSVDCLTILDGILNLLGQPWLLGDSALTSLLAKLSAIGRVALGLGFVIFIHELGHFLAAKTFGVRCDKFYIGFDVPIRIGPIRFPSTLGKFKWGETEYGIGIIPLGGYVKMLGQDDDPRNAKEEADKIRVSGGEEPVLDPRSYPAKPVWQRMIIISAGVVMNLISAVFLAAAAYFYGVPYTPSVVGNPTAGGPAWLAGMQPGDQVVQVVHVGQAGADDLDMRYGDMLTNIVMNGTSAQGKPIEVHLIRDGQKQVIQPTPSPKYRPDQRPILGFTIEGAAVLGAKVTAPYSKLDGASLGLEPGDRIVAVDGEQLKPDPRFETVLAHQLTSRLAAKWKQPVQLSIERPANAEKQIAAKTFEITLPPEPRKTFGLGFEIDPITAVRPGSPAAQAGFMVGDKLLSIDGEKIIDAMLLPYQFAERAGKTVKFAVQRGTEQLEIQIDSPSTPQFDSSSLAGSGELSLGGVGVAFAVSSVVSWVESAGNPNSAIQVGDKLIQYRWAPTESEQQEAANVFHKNAIKSLTKATPLDSFYNIVSLHENIQVMPAGSQFDFELQRQGKTISATQKIDFSTSQFSTDERGLMLSGISRTHQTDDVMEAMRLGLGETKRRFFDVLGTLKMLFTGNVGARDFAGPIMLFSIATEEASHSTSRLLLFLTLLSANLAILNFLPIPALDGGHMMFLTAEAIRGKPVNEEWQIRLTMLGVLGLLSLMAFVIFNDLFTHM